MSTSALSIAGRRPQLLARAADYVELTKPKIAALVLVSVAVSSFVARWGLLDLRRLTCTLLGTLLVASSASALNQWLERRADARMERTARRPLPAGRLSQVQVLWFSAATILLGTICLAILVNWVTAVWGLLTWTLYVWVYTPLKKITSLNTAVGAVAGAMPVFIGWSAAGVELDLRAACLFTTLFLWQFPHFMAIAWLYRDQYRRGGMKMLSVVDPTGRRVGMQAVLAALGLLAVSLVPGLVAPRASLYLVAVFALGVGQLMCAMWFFARLEDTTAKLLLRASLVYLPAHLTLLTLIPFI